MFGPGAGRVALEPLGHGVVAQATVGLWRARVGDRTAIVKVLAPAPEATGFWRPGTAVDHWYWWRREADAYASGLLATLAGATVTLSSGFVGSEDVLSFAAQPGITGTYNAATGVLKIVPE